MRGERKEKELKREALMFSNKRERLRKPLASTKKQEKRQLNPRSRNCFKGKRQLEARGLCG